MKNIVIQEIDTSNGVIFPFYDADTNIIYLCGKVCALASACAVNAFSNQLYQLFTQQICETSHSYWFAVCFYGHRITHHESLIVF